MDLLDRYLASVRRNLPSAKADDITAELRDVLLARAEDREESLGRPLTEEEWEALLVEFGHPLVVAARYREHQWLIGPELYPFYLYFMKLIGGLVVLGMVLAGVVKAALHQGEPGPLIVDFMGSLWWSVAATIGSVTIVFALIERYGGVQKQLNTWHPRQLPEIDLAGKEPKRLESVAEVALGIAVLLWWCGAFHLPVITNGTNFRLDLAPIWMTLYWPIFALLALRLVYNLVRWLAPGWGWIRGLLAILTTIGGIGLAVMLYRAGHWVTVVPTGMAADQAQQIQDSLDLSMRIGLVAASVVWAWEGLRELWRWMRGIRR